MKTPEDDIGENLNDLCYGDNFLDTTLKAQPMKEKNMNKLDFIKTKNFCSAKEIVKRIKREATDWEKIFATDIW